MKHFPFSNEPFQTQVGLSMLDLKDWIEIDDKRAEHVALKARLLQDHPDTVLAVADETQAFPAALELRDTLYSHLQEFFPRENWPPPTTASTARDALQDIARWVQEDFCLLSPVDQTVMAGLVCFPSRWKIPDKIGKNPMAVHKPVVHFAPIAKPTDWMLKKLTKPLVRFNWTIHDSSELYCPEAEHHEPAFQPEDVLKNTFVRVERQTLRRLEKTDAVAFSIRTHITRLDEVVADADRKARLRSTLETLPIEVAHYKGMKYFFEDLKKALKA
jgi:hypothetical protein